MAQAFDEWLRRRRERQRLDPEPSSVQDTGLPELPELKPSLLTRPLLPELDIESPAGDYLYNSILRESSSPAMLGLGAATGGGLAVAGRFLPTLTRGLASLGSLASGAMAGKDVYDFSKTGDTRELVDAGLNVAGAAGFRGVAKGVKKSQLKRIADGRAPLRQRIEAAQQLGNKELSDAIDKSFGKSARNFQRNFTKSGVEQLENLGVTGQKVARLLQRQVQTRRQLIHKYKEEVNSIIGDVPNKSFPILVDLVEGTKKKGPKVLMAKATQLREFFDKLGVDAREWGVQSRRTITHPTTKKSRKVDVPFISRKDYFPHRFDWTKARSFESKLKKQGLSQTKIDDILEELRDTLDPQIPAIYRRRLQEGGFYKKDKDSVFEHIEEMSEQMSRAGILGHNSLRNPQSPLGQALKAMGRFENEGTDIARRQLGRTTDRFGLSPAVHFFSNYQALNKLGLMLLSNMSGNNITVLQNESKILAQGAANIMKGIRGARGLPSALAGRHRDLVAQSGIYSDVGQTMINNLRSGKISRLQGINLAEDINRSFAGNLGISAAEVYLTRLKQDSTNKIWRKKLQDLVLTEDVDEIIRRGRLTDDELRYAAGRMAEITQGLGENMNLPNAWTGDAYKGLFTLFQRFALQGGKAIHRAIRENPERNIPLAVVLSQLVGEGIGDAKAVAIGTMRGAFSTVETVGQGIDKELEYRSKWPGFIPKAAGYTDKNRVLNRMIANTFDAWLLGLGTEIVTTMMEGPRGAAGALPNVQSVLEATSAIPDLNPMNPDLESFGRKATDLAPLPFGLSRGLQRGLFPSDAQQ